MLPWVNNTIADAEPYCSVAVLPPFSKLTVSRYLLMLCQRNRLATPIITIRMPRCTISQACLETYLHMYLWHLLCTNPPINSQADCGFCWYMNDTNPSI